MLMVCRYDIALYGCVEGNGWCSMVQWHVHVMSSTTHTGVGYIRIEYGMVIYYTVQCCCFFHSMRNFVVVL